MQQLQRTVICMITLMALDGEIIQSLRGVLTIHFFFFFLNLTVIILLGWSNICLFIFLCEYY